MLRQYLILLAALVVLSCGNSVDSDVEVNSDYLAHDINPRAHRLPDTAEPDMATHMLAHAYENLNLGLYDELLHSDFRYEFTPEDADSLGLPPDEPWWYKVPDVQSTQRLFEDPELISIRMDLERVTSWSLHTDSLTGLQGRLAQFEPDIRITVDFGPEPIIFLINGSVLDIFVVPVQDGGPADWRVLSIKESIVFSSGGNVLTEPLTWGSVKIMYR